MNRDTTSTVEVKATACLGPCGDGQNVVVVVDPTINIRIVDGALVAAKESSPGRLVRADMFGPNVKGVCQVCSVERAAWSLA
jgi:(2Fe-2S) ferredoxin